MEYLDPHSVVFQYTVLVVYITGLLVDAVYTFCEKTDKILVLLDKLSVLDWLDMILGPSLWPVRIVWRVYVTIRDSIQAQKLARELRDE